MSYNNPRDIVPSKGGVVQDLLLRVKLILRLLGDSRVSLLLKIIPLASIVYLFFPDLAPGPVDDAAVIWLGMYLFVELCPPEVVEEHMAALAPGVPYKGRQTNVKAEEEDILEGEFREDL